MVLGNERLPAGQGHVPQVEVKSKLFGDHLPPPVQVVLERWAQILRYTSQRRAAHEFDCHRLVEPETGAKTIVSLVGKCILRFAANG
jgi:hypothetical protein